MVQIRGLLLLIIPLLESANCFIPIECQYNVSDTTPGICCPSAPGSSLRCGGPVRGECVQVTAPHQTLSRFDASVVIDDRIDWPKKFFSKVCKCKGNFHGPACEECWYGWTGKNCDQRKYVLRRNVHSLTATERQLFHKIVLELARTPSRYVMLEQSHIHANDPLKNPKFKNGTVMFQLVHLHNYAQRQTFYKTMHKCQMYGADVNTNHNNVAFLGWHRHFILYWERMLNRIAEKLGWMNFGVPYWDWLNAKDCDVCTNSLFGDFGKRLARGGVRLHESSPFYKMRHHCPPPNPGYDGGPCYGCVTNRKWFLTRELANNYTFPTVEQYLYAHKAEKFHVSLIGQGLNCPMSFSTRLEGNCGPSKSQYGNMHNLVHDTFEGTFMYGSSSPSDPIFIGHHSQTDRLWECWMSKKKPSIEQYPADKQYPWSCRDCNMVGFIPPVTNGKVFSSLEDLGVRYDSMLLGQKRGRQFDCAFDEHNG